LNRVEATEVIWTLISLAGVVVSAWGFYLARGDIWALRLMGLNSSRLVVAKMGTRSAFTRVMVQAFFMASGILAMTRPAPLQAEFDPWRLVTIIFLFAAQIGTIISQIADIRDRTRLDQIGRAE